jgi:hypothetical protein
MSGFVFDPSRLPRSRRQQERDGYAVAGRMLRGYLGADPMAEVRRRVRRDPQLRAMLLASAAELAQAARVLGPLKRREDEP